MDDFEKEYFEKITKIASDFKSRRRDLAKARIKMFTASLYRQFIELNERFDVLIGAGNSGLYMTKIAEIVYKQLNIKVPVILNLPIYRFKEDNTTPHDNSSLLPQVQESLKNLPAIKSVLFIDDEIMRATTAKESLSLILNVRPDIKILYATIIAENHFFEWHYKMPSVSINFFAYSRLIQGLNGNIGYFIPEDLFKKISSLIDGVISYNHSMALVIGGALKRKNNNSYYFGFELDSVLSKKIKDYQFKKSSLMTELENLIKEGLEEYKSGKIKFRF